MAINNLSWFPNVQAPFSAVRAEQAKAPLEIPNIQTIWQKHYILLSCYFCVMINRKHNTYVSFYIKKH